MHDSSTDNLRNTTVAESTDIVNVRDIVKIYRGKETAPVKALNGVDFQLREGEFTAIVGPSGSGKTTLLNIIGSLDEPTSGSVQVAGVNLANMTRNELAEFRLHNIGFVFQSFNLIPVLTARENAEFTLLLMGVPAAERFEKTRTMLVRLGIEEELHDRLPSELSGGQQQRVAVARALVSEPALILADEPTANLDSVTGATLLDIMKEMNQQTGISFLFSTHDQLVIERATRRVVLRDGQIVEDSADSRNA